MPAYFESGFSVRETPWHGLGLVTDDYPESWEQARVWAGLTWEPIETPLYVQNGEAPQAGHYKPTFGRLADFKAISRSDTGDVLATVSDGYGLITHADMGEIVDAILGDAKARYETTIVIKGGRQVAALVRLDEEFFIDGDKSPHYPFMALLNSHDGSAACKVVNTAVRVVCWNTFQAASMDGDRSGRQFTFRHTRNVKDRIEDARSALQGCRSEAARWTEIASGLSQFKVTPEQVRIFTSEFIPMPIEGLVSDRVIENVNAARRRFDLILDSKTVDGMGVGGTAYGLVQAAGEFLDHVRGYRNADTYVGRTLLRPEPLKAKAMKLALEVVGA